MAFWLRRMANETTVHRWDAQTVSGRADPILAGLAVDGIDEMLTVLLPMQSHTQAPTLNATVHLHCTDHEGEWLVTFENGRATTIREHAKGDLAVRGPAASVYLWAWNRRPIGDGELQAFGDESLLDAWAAIGL